MSGERYTPPEARGEQQNQNQDVSSQERITPGTTDTSSFESQKEAYRLAIENIGAGREAIDPRTGERIKPITVPALQEDMIAYLNRGLEKARNLTGVPLEQSLEQQLQKQEEEPKKEKREGEPQSASMLEATSLIENVAQRDEALTQFVWSRVRLLDLDTIEKAFDMMSDAAQRNALVMEVGEYLSSQPNADLARIKSLIAHGMRKEVALEVYDPVKTGEKDPYILLGVASDASLEDIRAAYLRAVKQYHPDTAEGIGDTEGFMKIREAYQAILRDRGKDQEQAESFVREEEIKQIAATVQKELVQIQKSPEIQNAVAQVGGAVDYMMGSGGPGGFPNEPRSELISMGLFDALRHAGGKMGLKGKSTATFFGLLWLLSFGAEKASQWIARGVESGLSALHGGSIKIPEVGPLKLRSRIYGTKKEARGQA